MGLDKVKAEMLKHAKKTAQQISDEADAEVAKAVAKTDEEIKEQRSMWEVEFKEQLERVRVKELFGTRFDMKKKLLEQKKEIIDTLFADVKNELKKMPKPQKKKLYASLLDNAKSDIDRAPRWTMGRTCIRRTV